LAEIIEQQQAEKRLLMIAFHYPPYQGSSGVQRTLSFSRYLPKYGWSPIIVTAHPRAYPQVVHDQLGDIPPTVPVRRAFALDTAKQLAFRGSYLKWMALPDRWVSWFVGAIPVGLRLVRKYKPKIIWSTCPVTTAHLIGFALHRLTGLPWVADFRDPMNEIDPVTKQRWPADPHEWSAREWVERRAVKYCCRAVFVTPTALRIYAERYRELPGNRWTIIPNGYDEEHFVTAEQIAARRASANGVTVLLHSGTLYPSPDRDPRFFFTALANLRRAEQISATNFRVVLRASGYDDYYRNLIRETGVADIVVLQPAIPYREALAEMLTADGLLLFQGHDSNPAIPAKLYEYFRAKRPIFAMVDDEGDTAKVLKCARVGTIVPLNFPDRIVAGLLKFLAQIRDGHVSLPSTATIANCSRETRTQEFARLLDEIAK
jgi:glycosyltransferase involved in cell wall biosynthesis